jgi:hypothetical protein
MVIRRVATFSEFTPDNDPYTEHDFGSSTRRKLFWKIDAFDKATRYGRKTQPMRRKRPAC